jgi:Gnt-I system high-affinity gluconate transporter/Gnt-II system L-idonate transporter
LYDDTTVEHLSPAAIDSHCSAECVCITDYHSAVRRTGGRDGPGELIRSVQTGLGNTLGGLALVLALGIILGSILSETGAIRVISSRLLSLLGRNNAGTALMLTGFVVGLALFYNAGFVVLAPLVFSVAAQTGLPLAPLAISMAAPLSVTHGFLPPHPGATAVANALGADPGKTLLWGLAAGIPFWPSQR